MMRNIRCAVVFLLAPVLWCQDKNPLHGDKDAIESGRGMFRIYCSPCHGIRADGGRGPDLTIGQYTAGDSDQALYNVIANGTPGTEMGGYIERFGAENTWRLVSYLRSVAGKPAPKLNGDKVQGEKLFFGKGACGSCHRVGLKGSRMGPDLTLLGRQRSFDYIRKSLTDPNEAMTPGFHTLVVQTKDGKKITGIQRGFDSFSAQLMDAQENYHSFFLEDVAGIERRLDSMMPSYKASLNTTEMEHLLTYLLSLRGKESRP
jgi:putative heme-binding domain-containing protein